MTEKFLGQCFSNFFHFANPQVIHIFLCCRLPNTLNNEDRLIYELNTLVFYSYQCICKVLVKNYVDSVDYYITKVYRAGIT